MKRIFVVLMVFISFSSQAQDMDYARKVIDTLTSSYFWGRGYTNEGMKKAAEFIAEEMKKLGVKPLDGKSYLQSYSYPVNTFPGKMEVAINGKDLEPGIDFIISGESKGIKAKGNFAQKDSVTFIDMKNRIIVSLVNKLTWSPSPEEQDYTALQIDKNRFKELPASIKLNIDNKMIGNFKASNVCGIVRGTKYPDSFVVITAHYDHLGGMGDKVFFPGANDNASGTSMLLNMAKYYGANPQPYSIVLLAFAGEEIGLVGSKYFVDNPLLDMKKIKFLWNFDLLGTGDEGITVVNATEFKTQFDRLTALNKEGNFLPAVNARGKAANSDHHWFTEKGVPSFYIYTLGGIKAYHDVFDKSVTLPLTDYADLFKLLVRFNETLMK
jgi:hypothetical protein